MPVSNFKLFASTLKNITHRHLNRQEIGFAIQKELEPIERKHVTDYIQATRDFNPLYEKNKNLVPPFFISRLIWDHIKELLTNPNLHLNFFRMIHAGQSITWHRPIYINDKIDMTMTIKDIVDTPAGEMLQVRGAVFTGGEPIAEATTGLMIRAPHAGKKKGQSEQAFQGKELFRKVIQTHRGQNLEYARASKDTSFIHTSDFLARLAGLPGAIMHGICVMAMVSSAFTEEMLGHDITRLKAISNRFNSPAIPGERITMTCYEGKEKGVCSFTLVNDAEREIFKNGSIRYRA